MKINEIFYSIQGEGNWSGLPNIFIRTSGCNLRCLYCDTKYAYYSYNEFSINQIINKIMEFKCKKICITGGEPLLQDDIGDLIDILLKKDYILSIETNGSIDIKPYSNNENIMISLDIKCPSSNMMDKMLLNNINYLKKSDQLKFIIMNREDYNYAKKIIDDYMPNCSIFFQPVEGTNYKDLAEWILSDNLDVKIGLQIHKILWGNRRGL